MLTVTVRLYSVLRHRDKRTVDEIALTLDDNSTVDQVIERLELQNNLEFLISINGELAETDTPLSDGDSVAFIPLISGGRQT
jgi:molybdopterin converting factor small subunit